MLDSYHGPSNDRGLLRALVGEKISAAFRDGDGRIWLVVGNGEAVVFSSPDGHVSYWREDREAVQLLVSRRREEITRLLEELSDLDIDGLPGADRKNPA